MVVPVVVDGLEVMGRAGSTSPAACTLHVPAGSTKGRRMWVSSCSRSGAPLVGTQHGNYLHPYQGPVWPRSPTVPSLSPGHVAGLLYQLHMAAFGGTQQGLACGFWPESQVCGWVAMPAAHGGEKWGLAWIAQVPGVQLGCCASHTW